jgi:hypothetical protein
MDTGLRRRAGFDSTDRPCYSSSEEEKQLVQQSFRWTSIHQNRATLPKKSFAVLVFAHPPAGRMEFGVHYMMSSERWFSKIHRISRRRNGEPSSASATHQGSSDSSRFPKRTGRPGVRLVRNNHLPTMNQLFRYLLQSGFHYWPKPLVEAGFLRLPGRSIHR